ncbi:MAG: efflux transporter outer membrane subunit [Proteobacteria bacterium]|nr:efflux transporter outer membrane subunit [Pseudomonadota bacterium]
MPMPADRRPAPRRARFPLVGLSVLSVLAGCAALPQTPAAVALKTPADYVATTSLAASESDWPTTEWWRSYHDAQLDALVADALRDSPMLDIAVARLRGAEAVTQFAGAALKPTVTGGAQVTEERQSYDYLMPRAAVPQGWKDYGQVALNVGWELDFWGKNRAALAAAISEQHAREVEVAQTRLMLSTAVVLNYAELVHLYSTRDTLAAALAVRTQTLDLVRRRQRQELLTLDTVRQAEARQAAANAELQVVDERIRLQKSALAALAGAGPDRALTIGRPTAEVSGAFGLPQRAALDLLGRRPDIVAARLRTEAAARRIDQHKAEFYPSVNLMGVTGLLSLGLDNLAKSNSSFGSVGPAVSLPIFNTDRLQGQLRGAHAEYDAAAASYNAALLNALHEVADVVTSRQALDGELVSLQASVAAAAEAHRIVSRRYQSELTTYLDVLAAEDVLLSTQRALADAEARALTLHVSLVKALGGGYEQPASLSHIKTHSERNPS